jgi:hypothetical protein
LYATHYEYDDIYDILSPVSSGGVYHVFALKARSYRSFISRRPLEIGSAKFEPGEAYSRFGSDKKTSAGFVWYDGGPLTFTGTYKNNALFESPEGPFEFMEFSACYWSWEFSLEHSMFISITAQRAARRMDL